MRSPENQPDAGEVLAKIRSMLNDRRAELLAEWEKLERGSLESAENLARTDEVTEVKWAIVDAFHELYGLSEPTR